MNAVIIVLISVGILFLFLGTLGIVRFPDPLTRLHAASMTEALANVLIVLGLALDAGFSLTSIKILAIAVFIFLTSPVAAHAIARAAYRTGMGREPEGGKK